MQHYYKQFLVFAVLLTSSALLAQKPHQPSSAEIYQSLKKLNVLGNVLYLAAHPDDENTRLIGYMANKELVNTAYLSLTRGDGGQNLVGPELGKGLGVIRTQELLAARRTDGSQQFFTRANDFGYSKNAEETLSIWDKERVLHDMVMVIRQFRPDIIITRFPPDSRAGHGHHTSSAVLAKEAFDLAGDKNAYPRQLEELEVWQPKRLLMNTGRWWNKEITADKEGVVTIDVGQYNSTLGQSYNELAALSRSQHKSQGFGSTGSRGETIEFLEHLKGDRADNDLFEEIDLTWSRVKGGQQIQTLVEKTLTNYSPNSPEKSIEDLILIKNALNKLKNGFWKTKKLKEVDQLIIQCSGLYLEAVANGYYISPGQIVPIDMEAINRSDSKVLLKRIWSEKVTIDSVLNLSLTNNIRNRFKTSLKVPENMAYSQPYWLVNKAKSEGVYIIDNKDAGKGENEPAIIIKTEISINNEQMTLDIPVVYKWNDPVKGELYRPLNVIPPVSINVVDPVLIFRKNQSKKIEVVVKSGKDGLSTVVKPVIPKGWKVTPEEVKVDLEKNGEEQQLTFMVTSPNVQETINLDFEASLDGKTYSKGLTEINYDHIPSQIILTEAGAKLVNIDVTIAGSRVGYIHGAGDAVPQGLRNIGYEVDELTNEEINLENLRQYDAIVLGIRALNINDRTPFYMDDLMKYTSEGGTLVMQYNTSHRLKTQNFSPYPMKLSRDRVTLESAEMRILTPKHAVLNKPNKITNADFGNWVQERGLYFPNEWDVKYDAVLSINDPGETPKDGSLLVTAYGKGHYVYTGLSFFREIPAGVPGAYRLLANIVSLSK